MKIITTSKAPAAVGPYSQAIKLNDVLYCSGMLPLNPETGVVVGITIEEQTEQIFKNIRALLESEGLTLDRVVKSLVFLQTMDDFSGMNTIYAREFGEHKPVRSCVAVADIPKGALVEIEVVVSYK